MSQSLVPPMPAHGERGAPHFDPAKPHGLRRFFDDLRFQNSDLSSLCLIVSLRSIFTPSHLANFPRGGLQMMNLTFGSFGKVTLAGIEPVTF